MDQDTKSKKGKEKIIIISIVILFLASLSGLGLLMKTMLFDNYKSVPAKDILAAYIKPNSIAGLSSTLYSQQANTTAGIEYKSNDKKYSIHANTQLSMQFFAKNKSQKDDSATVQSQSIAFMEKQGLTKTTTPSTDDKTLHYTTFINKEAICQSIDFTPPTTTNTDKTIDARQYHQISCMDKKVIDDEYASIEKLLTIYKKSQNLPEFTRAVRTVNSDKNVSYSLVNLTNNSTHNILLFASVNNNWEFLGDLAVGDAQYSTGKYIITPEVKSKISDPKYNGIMDKQFLPNKIVF